jgi:hypothetical protein
MSSNLMLDFFPVVPPLLVVVFSADLAEGTRGEYVLRAKSGLAITAVLLFAGQPID